MNSASPSPDRTSTMSTTSTPSHLTDKEIGASPSSSSASSLYQRGSSYSSIRPPKQTYANLYEPSSPSPLSSSLFPSSSSDHLDRFKTHSRCSSPTLKRAVKFAAAATQGSLDSSSGLSVERIKDKITGLSGRGEYNSTADMIFPGSQPGHDDKKEYSPAPSYASPVYGDGFTHHQRDITPPPQHHHQSTSSSSSALSPPGLPYNNNGNSHYSGHHGMRTPPPSGGKDMDMSQYSSLGAHGSRTTMRMRRDSGTTQTGKTDDLTTLLRRGGPSSLSTSSSSRPESAMYRP
jgi:hypothetical protein